MAKASKEFEWRMSGMIYAADFAKKNGLEELEKDIRKRGFLRGSIGFSQKELDETLEFLSRNLYETTMTVWLMTLHDAFGFGKKRLQCLKDSFDKHVKDVTEFDYLGSHYVTMEDYANYLYEKFGIKLDTRKLETCQNSYTGDKLNKGKADIKKVVEMLRENGFKDAAQFIEKRI